MRRMTDELVGREHDVRAVTELLTAGTGVLLVGGPGVGKSRLAQHVADRLAADRSGAVEVVNGTVPGRSVPLGAVAHLIEPMPGVNEAIVLSQVAARLEDVVTGGGVVVVDDIDLIDDSTRVAVHRLGSRVPIVATARTGDADDPFIVGLWKDRLVERVDIKPLDRSASNELAVNALGGAVDGALADELWRRAAGNPLLTQELCTAGSQSGAIASNGDAWLLDGDLLAGDRIVDLIRIRLDELDDEQSLALAAIAMLDPMPIEFADQLGVRTSLDELTRRRLAIELGTGDRSALRPAHPIVAEAVRATLSASRVGALADRLADLDGSALLPSDARRVAGVLILADHPPGASLALAGAVSALATFDHPVAEELARAALDDDIGAATRSVAHRVLGQALAGRGLVDEAIVALQSSCEHAPDPAQRAAGVLALAETLMFAAGRPQEAPAHLRRLLDDLDPADPHHALARLQLALASGIVDELRTADELAAELVAGDELPPPAMLPALMVHTLARSMSGQVDGADEALDRGDALARQFRTTQPLARDQFGLNRVLVEQARGDVAESARLVASVRSADDFADRVQGPWFYIDVAAAYGRGGLAEAVDDIERSLVLHRASDPVGTLPLALAMGGLAHAVAGDGARSRELIDECIGLGGNHQERTRVWMGVAEAWLLARDDRLDEAAELAVSTGRHAVDAWHIVWGAVAAHAAVRFGRRDLATPVLSDLDAGPLVAMLAAHAAADTPDAMAKVAVQFGDAGLDAFAADAWAAIANAEADPLITTAAAQRAVTLGDRCSGALSPLLAAVEPPLSPRQQEIATLAAAGRASRDIADELFVSTKTVDNHLQAIYRTLGISSRSELAAFFD